MTSVHWNNITVFEPHTFSISHQASGRAILAVLFMIIFCGIGAASARAQTVPAPYQDLYTELSADLKDFNNAVNGVWKGDKYPVLYTGQLTNANSNNGTQMLGSTFMTAVNNQLLLLKAVGDKAVAVEVSFPMLYEPFFTFIGQPAQY